MLWQVREIEYGRGSGKNCADAEWNAAKQAVMRLCELNYDGTLFSNQLHLQILRIHKG